MPRWFYLRGETTLGPFSAEELRILHSSGAVTDETWVWREGMAEWQTYGTVPELFAPPASLHPPGALTLPCPHPLVKKGVCVRCGERVPRRWTRAALLLLVLVSLVAYVVVHLWKPAFLQPGTESRVLAHDEQTRLLLNWLRANRTPLGMPLSFQVPGADTMSVYERVGTPEIISDVMERIILKEGLIVYDGAVWQIVMSATGVPSDLALAEAPLTNYRTGYMGRVRIRSGPPHFVYDPVFTDLYKEQRGFIFKVINAYGKYETEDPLNGRRHFPGWPNFDRIHWEDWYPIAGENAWLAMAALQIHHRKYFDTATQSYKTPPGTPELEFARELAEVAITLQADNGGIRMGPMGISRGEVSDTFFWYFEISTENTLSWYSAFRMLHQITNDVRYKFAMQRVENFLRWAYLPGRGVFAQGAHFQPGRGWIHNPAFAVDCQTWGIISIRPELIDDWFGRGACAEIWRRTKALGGYRKNNTLAGIGFTEENDQLSVEWTGGAILATRLLASWYRDEKPELAAECLEDARSMRRGVDELYWQIAPDQAAYSYSLQRKYIPFGWWAHDKRVLSTVSTCWIVLMNNNFNPFFLGGDDPLLPPL